MTFDPKYLRYLKPEDVYTVYKIKIPSLGELVSQNKIDDFDIFRELKRKFYKFAK